jgi:polysaccharide export outer membrane protein
MTACRRLLVVAMGAALLVAVLAAPGRASDYRIGPEDVLTISVWDNKELDQVVFVRPDGTISLPLVGEVRVAGQAVAELARSLNELYRQTIKGAQVVVSVKEIRSRPVFFVGGVARSGPIQLTRDLTLLQAISLVGGLAPTADLESAFLLRGDRRIGVDFVQLMRGGLQYNIPLEPGDTVVVPVADVVYVQGEVKSAGPIKYTKDLTIVGAIVRAGGFTPVANARRVSLIRGEGVKKETIRVNVNEMMNNPEEAGDIPLRPNDVVIVSQRLF